MRGFVPPLPAAADSGRSSNEVDELLRAYFRAKLPNPWPDLTLPVAGIPARLSPPLWSSRSALAAALAFLLIGSLALSAAFRGHGPTAYSGAGPFTATGDPFGFGKELPDVKPNNGLSPDSNPR